MSIDEQAGTFVLLDAYTHGGEKHMLQKTHEATPDSEQREESTVAPSCWLTTAQVAADLQVSTRLVQSLVKQGEIPASRVGLRSLRIARGDVLAYMERHRQK
jgi:excisionase family DNA binding protein